MFLILAIEDQNNESYRGVDPSKKEEKFPLFEKFPTEEGGGGGLERLGWFPNFYRFGVMMASLRQIN